MSVSTEQLLDNLEQRWVLMRAELDKLRKENAELKRQLDQAHGSVPEPVPETDDPDVVESDVVVKDVQETNVEEKSVEEKNVAAKTTDAEETAEETKTEPAPTAASPADEPASEAVDAEPPSPHALLAQWYQRYPKAFFKGHTQPLKVGIHHDLAEHEPWSGKLIRRALANYVNLPRYIKSVREGVVRIDLEGNDAGVVDAEAARHAAEKRTQQASASPSERPQETKNPKARGKTPKRTKKIASKEGDKAQNTPSTSDSPQKKLSLEDKLLGLQQKFQSR
ncbi:ProQ/FINO family protein [Vreelandella arcis]|uniref:ProP effector n=1 Tax=Vreelandella arcis TaxID=416873 RepID=A0A1H0CVN2_9GAMM|nr:ProQ/FINO family protein [Halomonas arcis]SDN61957.1 ProP effector [Halomonas arcis]